MDTPNAFRAPVQVIHKLTKTRKLHYPNAFGFIFQHTLNVSDHFSVFDRNSHLPVIFVNYSADEVGIHNIVRLFVFF